MDDESMDSEDGGDNDIADFDWDDITLLPYDVETMMSSESTALVIGKRGSGKTRLLMHILKYMRRKLDMCIAFCPTDANREELKKHIPRACVYNEYNEADLQRAYKGQEKLGKATFRDPVTRRMIAPVRRRIGVVLDDCMAEKEGFNAKVMRQIMMNGRHNKVFYINNVQYVIDVPKNQRGQIDVVFCFPMFGKKNLQPLQEGVLGCFPSIERLQFVFNQLPRYHALVYDVKAQQDKRPFLFYIKAEGDVGNFRVGSNMFWYLYYRNFVRSHEMGVDLEIKAAVAAAKRSKDANIGAVVGADDESAAGGGRKKPKGKQAAATARGAQAKRPAAGKLKLVPRSALAPAANNGPPAPLPPPPPLQWPVRKSGPVSREAVGGVAGLPRPPQRAAHEHLQQRQASDTMFPPPPPPRGLAAAMAQAHERPPPPPPLPAVRDSGMLAHAHVSMTGPRHTAAPQQTAQARHTGSPHPFMAAQGQMFASPVARQTASSSNVGAAQGIGRPPRWMGTLHQQQAAAAAGARPRESLSPFPGTFADVMSSIPDLSLRSAAPTQQLAQAQQQPQQPQQQQQPQQPQQPQYPQYQVQQPMQHLSVMAVPMSPAASQYSHRSRQSPLPNVDGTSGGVQAQLWRQQQQQQSRSQQVNPRQASPQNQGYDNQGWGEQGLHANKSHHQQHQAQHDQLPAPATLSNIEVASDAVLVPPSAFNHSSQTRPPPRRATVLPPRPIPRV
jgi:hypothetical protein